MRKGLKRDIYLFLRANEDIWYNGAELELKALNGYFSHKYKGSTVDRTMRYFTEEDFPQIEKK